MPANQHIAVLLLGSNLGDRITNLNSAIADLSSVTAELPILSSVYETTPWGDADQPGYLNQVIILKTYYSPEDLLKFCLDIERNHGRVRTNRYGSRTLDIDILFYDDLIVEKSDLCIPHPRIQERKFTLIPLCELIPDFIHPVAGQALSELLSKCPDKGTVTLGKY